MSKFFIDQLARILVGEVNSGAVDCKHFVPIISKGRTLKIQDILSFRLVRLSFEKIAFPIEGLDKSYSFTHSKLY